MNVDDSIIILGSGRSGTTLMQKIIAAIPNTKEISEVGGMLLGCTWAEWRVSTILN